MPITAITYKLIRDMSLSGIIPEQPHILELGESNWYGDLDIEQLQQDINQSINNAGKRKALHEKFLTCKKMLSAEPPKYSASWDLSQLFFKVFLNYETYQAIDLSGSESALKLDLNHPVKLDRQYEIVIDFGTAEHVFNIYQLFKTVHEVTRPNGLMIHGLPFHGWIDHGFYNFQPTFFIDLATVNNYAVKNLLYWNDTNKQAIPLQNREQVSNLFKSDSVSGNATLFATFQKSEADSDFKIPMQGYYAGTVSDSVHSAWHSNR